MPQASRIYNLFPLLAGSVEQWETHLPRIAAMGFNWVFVNPFHYPGFSGSLYAVKDYYRLHPVFQGDSQDDPATLLRPAFREYADHLTSIPPLAWQSLTYYLAAPWKRSHTGNWRSSALKSLSGMPRSAICM